MYEYNMRVFGLLRTDWRLYVCNDKQLNNNMITDVVDI